MPELILRNVWKLHRKPETMGSNQGIVFIPRFKTPLKNTTQNIMFSEKKRVVKPYTTAQNSSGNRNNVRKLKGVLLSSFTVLLCFVVLWISLGALCYKLLVIQFCGPTN